MCVRSWSCAHTASYQRRWGWWLSSAPAPAPAWPPEWARPWPGWTSFCGGLRDNKTLSHRNIGVWFEKAISCLFISQQTEDKSNNVVNKTTRLRETGQYKILSCYSPRITGRHWINYPTSFSDSGGVITCCRALTQIVPHVSDLKPDSLPHVAVSAVNVQSKTC